MKQLFVQNTSNYPRIVEFMQNLSFTREPGCCYLKKKTGFKPNFLLLGFVLFVGSANLSCFHHRMHDRMCQKNPSGDGDFCSAWW